MALRSSKNRERRCRGSGKWNPSHLLPRLEEGRHYNTKRRVPHSCTGSPLVKSVHTQEFALDHFLHRFLPAYNIDR